MPFSLVISQVCLLIVHFLISGMVRVSVLADCLRAVVNAERAGKRQVMIRPASKVVMKTLEIMQKKGYVGDVTLVDDRRAGRLVVNLTGRLNKAGAISPRYDVAVDDMENWVNRLLPSRLFGHILLTTSDGILTHSECISRHIGGKVLAYFW